MQSSKDEQEGEIIREERGGVSKVLDRNTRAIQYQRGKRKERQRWTKKSKKEAKEAKENNSYPSLNSQWSLSAKPCTELQCAVVSTHRAAAPGLHSFTRNITFSVESGAANSPKMSSNALNVPKALLSFTRSLWTVASRQGKSPFKVSCDCQSVPANANGPRQRSAGAPNGKSMDTEVPCRLLNARSPMCSREGNLPATVKFPR